jgi:3-oxoadipate enol-lactonase
VTIVLLHPFPLDERAWEPQAAVLAGRPVSAPRLYGLGGSIEAWAARVLAKTSGDVIAVGASMGGYTALEMARQAPERVRGILLAGSKAAADSPERKAQRDGIAAMLRTEGVEAWYRQSGNPAPEHWVLEQRAEDLANAMEVLRDRPDATDVVRSFGGPLLIVVGTRDDIVSVEEARELAASAPDGKVEVIEGAGHFVGIDAPDRFNALLEEFLAQWT